MELASGSVVGRTSTAFLDAGLRFLFTLAEGPDVTHTPISLRPGEQ
jgi:hypothetical protein